MSSKNDQFIEQNGIRIYTNGNKPPIPAELRTDFEVVSLYGFKVVEIEGKKMWAVATEEDYRTSEAKRLGIRPEEVRPKEDCPQTGPDTCSNWGCANFPQEACNRLYDPNRHHYYCACTQG